MILCFFLRVNVILIHVGVFGSCIMLKRLSARNTFTHSVSNTIWNSNKEVSFV